MQNMEILCLLSFVGQWLPSISGSNCREPLKTNSDTQRWTYIWTTHLPQTSIHPIIINYNNRIDVEKSNILEHSLHSSSVQPGNTYYFVAQMNSSIAKAKQTGSGLAQLPETFDLLPAEQFKNHVLRLQSYVGQILHTANATVTATPFHRGTRVCSW